MILYKLCSLFSTVHVYKTIYTFDDSLNVKNGGENSVGRIRALKTL